MPTETLYVSGAGDECGIASESGCSACPNHYTCVDESPGHDGDSSLIYGALDVWQRDLYAIANHSVGSGTINWVRVYAVMRVGIETGDYGKLSIKSGGVAANSAAKTLTASWATYYQQWTTPPEGGAWTWAKIDALQAGVSLYGVSAVKVSFVSLCTQVYVVVDYTPPPIPDPPTNVQATDGVYTDRVRITWIKSSGATGYQVYRNGVALGWLGDVATFDDFGAGAPSITKGTVTATDGAYTNKVRLDASGYGTNNGATHTYKVRAKSAAGESGDSGTNTGYRKPGTLYRQWQKSAGDSASSYSNISGATSDPYDYTGAPAPTITPGNADASDGLYTTHVALSLSGQSANVGAGRYYRAQYTATGCTTQYTSGNRGYRGVGSLTYQWQRSAADSDASYSNISGATTASYNDTAAPADGSGRYYRCVENATGAAEQTSNSDRGYRWVGGKTVNMGVKMIEAGLI